MASILDEIVAAKRVALAESKTQVSLAALETAAAGQPRLRRGGARPRRGAVQRAAARAQQSAVCLSPICAAPDFVIILVRGIDSYNNYLCQKNLTFQW